MSAYLWAQHRKEWFVSMSLCLNGLPSYDTLNRVFRFLNHKAFNSCFMEWLENAILLEGCVGIKKEISTEFTKSRHLAQSWN